MFSKWFKKKDPNCLKALELHQNGDKYGAFKLIRNLFHDKTLPEEQDKLHEYLETLAIIGVEFAGEDFKKQINSHLKGLSNPKSLYLLGYALYEFRLYDIASCVLTRAYNLEPGNMEIITELVSALEEQGRNIEAVNLLLKEEQVRSKSFFCRYLLVFNAFLSAEIETAKNELKNLGAPENENEIFLKKRLQRLDSSYDLISSEELNLRHWNFVTTGSTLFHLSEYGFDEGMNGRYAFTQDSYERCKFGLLRLKYTIEKLTLKPTSIISFDDKNSKILAIAASKLLGLPLIESNQSNLDNSLFISYNIGDLEFETPPLWLEHHGNQIIYSHSLCWTEPPICTPDFINYLFQSQTTPWGKRLGVGKEREVIQHEESTESIEELAERILNAGSFATFELDSESHFERFIEKVLPKLNEEKSGRREPYWEGSPIKSSRFV